MKELLAGHKKVTIHASLPENQESEHQFCLELSGRTLSYNLSNGAPVMPIRDLSASFKGAIGEIVAFINGAHTLEDLKKFGCPEIFWGRWVTAEKCANFGLETGDLGAGSYGAVLTATPMPGGKTFNQIDALIRQMKRMPNLRTHVITTWYPPYDLSDKEQDSPRKVVVAPCHGNMVMFNVYPETNEMDLVHVQRSADVPVGLPLNMIEWTAFGMMVSYITGIKLRNYIHMLPNPQIYDIQIPQIQQLLEREVRKLPTMHLRPQREILSITDFRREDFVLEDYHPHEKMMVRAII
ncbi:MAG: thymidylate synthase [Patescibacteria group bacterium]